MPMQRSTSAAYTAVAFCRADSFAVRIFSVRREAWLQIVYKCGDAKPDAPYRLTRVSLPPARFRFRHVTRYQCQAPSAPKFARPVFRASDWSRVFLIRRAVFRHALLPVRLNVCRSRVARGIVRVSFSRDFLLP